MKAAAPARVSEPGKGIALMIASMSAIAVVDALAKVQTQWHHGIQVTFGYFATIAIWIALYALVTRRRLPMPRRPGLQVVRALCLVASLSCLFVGLTYLPLADATVISFVSPLFVVALSGPLLGERIGPHRWGAVVVGFIGATIVVRPGSDVFQWAAVLPLVGAAFFAGFQIVTRHISAVDDKLTTLMCTAVIGALALAIPQPFFWTTPDLAVSGLALATGGLGFLAHILMIHAFDKGDASMLAPFNYVRIVWAIGLGVLLFGQFPDLWTLGGGALIVASGFYVLYRETRAVR